MMTRSDDLTGERVLDLDDFERLYDSTAGSVVRYFFRRTGSLSRYLRWRRVDSRARKRLGMHPQVDLDSESRDRIEDLIYLKERIGQLDQALNTLSPKLALAVNLRVGHQLAYSEVADELGISEATARARVSRGLAQLAESLEEEL
jgi:RNA polymerase sigma-70 factor (ECF subfamily)